MAGVVVVGAGPGIGAAVARRFGGAGLPVTVVARTDRSLARVRADLAGSDITDVLSLTADAADAGRLVEALRQAEEVRGTPEVLVYNAGWIRADRPGELDQAGHLKAYAVNVLGALNAAAYVAPRMAERGSGTILLTGGMPEPLPSVVSLSLGKAALRALTEVLAAEYGPRGVRVATITVGGAVEPGTDFDPDRIARHYWRLHMQPKGSRETEYLFAGEPYAPLTR